MRLHTPRSSFALRWAFGHLLCSAAVAALSAPLVLGFWYVEPWRQMFGVAGILGMVIVVDVVGGPLMTLVLASPQKSRRELWADLALVAFLQLAALGYGLWAVYSARPVALVFEVDRFVVVTANEVQIDQLGEAPLGLDRLPMAGVRLMAARQAQSQEEQLQSVELSLQGITSAMRPGWWRPFEDAQAAISNTAKPLADLLNKRTGQRGLIEDAAKKTGLPLAGLQYLPLTSTKQLDWVILVNGAGEIVGHAHVDGFD